MSLFQMLMVAAALFFAYQIILHVRNLEDPSNPATPSQPEPEALEAASLVIQADAAYEAGRYDESATLLRDALETERENSEIMGKLAFVLAKTGHADEAKSLYKAALERDNDDVLHSALASLYRSEGDFEAAKTHYEAALAIDDTYAVTYFNYANLLLDMNRRDDARAMYEKAIALDPDFTQAKFELEKLK